MSHEKLTGSGNLFMLGPDRSVLSGSTPTFVCKLICHEACGEKRSGFRYEVHVLRPCGSGLSNFAYSALARFNTGALISASLHNSKKSRYAAPALTVSP